MAAVEPGLVLEEAGDQMRHFDGKKCGEITGKTSFLMGTNGGVRPLGLGETLKEERFFSNSGRGNLANQTGGLPQKDSPLAWKINVFNLVNHCQVKWHISIVHLCQIRLQIGKTRNKGEHQKLKIFHTSVASNLQTCARSLQHGSLHFSTTIFLFSSKTMWMHQPSITYLFWVDSHRVGG